MNSKFHFFKISKSAFYFLAVVLSVLTLHSCGAGKNPEKVRVLMVGGGSSHDFDKWYKGADSETLERDEFATVTYIDNTDDINQYLDQIDVLFLSNNQPINDPQVRKRIFEFVEAGNGLILSHAALWYNWADWPEYNQNLVGGGSRGHDRYGEFTVTVENPSHPITNGVEQNFTLEDELYYFKPDSKGPGIEVLATASAPGSEESFPSVFTVNHKKGRIVGIALGHDAESHNLPAYQRLLKNAITWASQK